MFFSNETLRKSLMKKLILFTIITMASYAIAFSQSYRFELPPGENKIIIKDKPINLEGSPYLNEEWQTGSIFLSNGDTIPTINLRLNVLKGEMQYQFEEKTYVIGAPEGLKEIIIGGCVFIYLTYTKDSKLKKNYFEVLSNGKSSLLKYHYIVILPANFNPALNSGNKNDQIIHKMKYYAKIGDNFIEIDKRGKNLISAFGNKEALISKYIKDNKISLKNESDLITLIKYSNTL